MNSINENIFFEILKYLDNNECWNIFLVNKYYQISLDKLLNTHGISIN